MKVKVNHFNAAGMRTGHSEFQFKLEEDEEFPVKEFFATVETFLKMIMHGRLPMIRTRQM